MSDPTITFTPELRDKLREAYENARDEELGVFIFEGHELVTDYAKYVLEYLDGLFAANSSKNT